LAIRSVYPKQGPDVSGVQLRYVSRFYHDMALGRVMMRVFKDDTDVFKQFGHHESFRRWLTDTVFSMTSDTPASGPAGSRCVSLERDGIFFHQCSKLSQQRRQDRLVQPQPTERPRKPPAAISTVQISQFESQ